MRCSLSPPHPPETVSPLSESEVSSDPTPSSDTSSDRTHLHTSPPPTLTRHQVTHSTTSTHLHPHTECTAHPHTTHPHTVSTTHPHTTHPHTTHPHTTHPHTECTTHPHTTHPHTECTTHPHTTHPHTECTTHPVMSLRAHGMLAAVISQTRTHLHQPHPHQPRPPQPHQPRPPHPDQPRHTLHPTSGHAHSRRLHDNPTMDGVRGSCAGSEVAIGRERVRAVGSGRGRQYRLCHGPGRQQVIRYSREPLRERQNNCSEGLGSEYNYSTPVGERRRVAQSRHQSCTVSGVTCSQSGSHQENRRHKVTHTHTHKITHTDSQYTPTDTYNVQCTCTCTCIIIHQHTRTHINMHNHPPVKFVGTYTHTQTVSHVPISLSLSLSLSLPSSLPPSLPLSLSLSTVSRSNGPILSGGGVSAHDWGPETGASLETHPGGLLLPLLPHSTQSQR